MEFTANPKFPAIPSTGGTQSIRFTASGFGDVGTIQSWNEGTLSLIFFATNRLYNGNSWSSLNTRAGYVFQMQDNAALFYNFPANSNSFTIRFNLDSLGNLSLPTGNLSIQGNQVLGARKTGWQTPAGTITRTGFNTGTANFSTLSQIVGAIVTDLMAHGLLGS